MSFEVQTVGYEGPIGLLLSLITTQKVDLWALSVSDLVDSYLLELDKIRQLDLEVATEFLVIASTLLELKCRRLVPGTEPTSYDEDYAFFEERDLLIARLLEAKTYRDASFIFIELFERAALSTPRIGSLEQPFLSMTPDILSGVTPERLAGALRRLYAPQQDVVVDASHLARETVSISQVARHVIYRLTELKKCSFADLMSNTNSRMEIVVGFLSILELYRQSRVALDQQEALGDITIEWTSGKLTTEEVQDFLEISGFELEVN